jgi:hypothetical protein
LQYLEKIQMQKSHDNPWGLKLLKGQNITSQV